MAINRVPGLLRSIDCTRLGRRLMRTGQSWEHRLFVVVPKLHGDTVTLKHSISWSFWIALRIGFDFFGELSFSQVLEGGFEFTPGPYQASRDIVYRL